MFTGNLSQRLWPAAALTLLSLSLTGIVHAEIDASKQMLLGNPDKATTSTSNKAHFLIKRPQYALSYNDTLHYPNWVSWKLDASDVGREPRGQFQPDTTLPSGFTVITPNDYTRSGYDRGHNCPAADRSASPTDSAAVFLMSNMTPQAHGMNAGPWEGLESESRTLAKRGNSLYIIAGHSFSAPTHNTIGRKGIAVPDFGWKIVVIAPVGKPITAESRVIAVRMPNNNTISKKRWQDYVTTPAELEKATGLTFFDALPKDVADALRNKKDSSSHGASTGSGATVTSGSDNPPATSAGTGEISIEEATKRGLVWVNLSSGKYWKPGTQYYGTTKRGKFMTEDEAKAGGYMPVRGQ